MYEYFSNLKANLDVSSINDFMSNIKKNDQCQTDKKNNILKAKYRRRLLKHSENSENLKRDLKNYYQHVDGDNGYKNHLLKKYKEEGETIKKDALLVINNIYDNIQLLLESNSINNMSNNYVNELIDNKLKKKLDALDKLDNEKKKTYTNERKVSYIADKTDFMNNIKTYIIYLYYILFIIYVLFVFILKNNYTNIKNWLYITFAGILPFLIVNFTFSISNLIVSLYKFLEYNLRDEII